MDVLNELFICYFEFGDLNDSEWCFELVLELVFEDIRVISNLGVFCLKYGDIVIVFCYFCVVYEIDFDDFVVFEYLVVLDF